MSMGGWYPENPLLGQRLQGELGAPVVDKAFIAHYSLLATEATAAVANGIHAAVTDTGLDQTITTGFTQPTCPRNITATAGGTNTDVKAIQVIVHGTNAAGAVISETLPAFTVNVNGIVSGVKAFKTITSVVIPAHDGVGATTAIGFGEVLGFPHLLPANTVLFAALAGVKEGTAPTVVADIDELEKNTFDLNSALNGTVVDVWYVV